MWVALFGGNAPYPTSESEPVEFTLSLKQGVVRGPTSVGPALSVSVRKWISGGVFRYQMKAVFPDTVSPADVLLNECLIRLTSRQGLDGFGNSHAVAVLWPVVVDGKQWLAHPPWLSESRDTQLLPAHLLNDTTRDAQTKVLEYGALGVQMYRAAGASGRTMSGTLAKHVDISAHSNANADVFAPSDTMRLLTVYRAPVEVVTPPTDPVTVPATTDAATKADIRMLERRVATIQAGLANVAAALGKMATYDDVLLAKQQARADAAAVNRSVAAVGDHIVINVPPRKERLIEQAGMSLLTGTLSNILTK